MRRNLIQPILMLLAAGALTASLSARTPSQDKPKELPRVQKPEPAPQAPKERTPSGEAPKQKEPSAQAPAADGREIAKKAAHFEAVHRDRIARIDRLIEIYKQKGDRAKVAELEALREAQSKRHANAMSGFRKQLGDDKYDRLEKEMHGPNERARAKRNEHANEKLDKPKEDAPKKERSKTEAGTPPQKPK